MFHDKNKRENEKQEEKNTFSQLSVEHKNIVFDDIYVWEVFNYLPHFIRCLSRVLY